MLENNVIENKGQTANFSEEESVNMTLQLIVETYLKSKGQPSMKELLAKENLEYKPGVLYNYHIYFLQLMISEELKNMGLDLIEEIEKTGEKFETGKLSTYENKYLGNRVVFVASLAEVVNPEEV